MIQHTEHSLKITQEISNKINNLTFHHHYHILYDIVNTYPTDYNVKYVEIGCYGGASAALVLQRPNTSVISIDLGNPIPMEIAVNNVNKLNVHKNSYKYIKGSSHSEETKEMLLTQLSEIDVLFIDGDHSVNGVKKDFEIYEKFVKLGGYVVFDDYNDHRHSPGVKIGVNQLLPEIEKTYNIIGTIPNTLGARPIDRKEGNCFIIKKKNG
jgi:hypothetical protein